ncbi:MAG: hypothetical protein QOH21_406 [Acidobacteriota bacterium]|nr:hypothetical protein [Acidobacteriota bacterium]
MIADNLLPEFDQEMKTTRTLLERVPAEHIAFKPHPKSTTLGDLSLHVANLLTWTLLTIEREEFDVAAPDAFPKRTFTTTEKLIADFDALVVKARAALAAASDETLQVPWTLRSGTHTVFTMPRVGVLRSFVLNHGIHHRGQLSVYLRMNDVALPEMYGPTADTR